MTDKNFIAQLKEWRHYLHMHPETAFEEKNTAAFVAKKLQEMGIQVATGIGGTGVVGTLTVGDGKEVIGLRADMDALNLPEQGQPPYVSQNPGKMHGCGHDGHTTTLWERLSSCPKGRILTAPSALFSSRRKNRAKAPTPC